MNLFQLVLKQMRQRALSTWLTLLSIVLGVALAVAIMILHREGSDLFVQKNYGYEVIVGPPKGSPLQLVLNTVYQIDVSPGNVPYSVYEDLVRDRFNVKIAVPVAVGDSYKGLRIVGTTPRMFNADEEGRNLTYVRYLQDHGERTKDDQTSMLADEAQPLLDKGTVELDEGNFFQYRSGDWHRMAQGRVFHARKFEAIIGSDVTRRVGLKLGDKFQASHGLPQPGEEEDHEHEQEWTVVGVLEKTHTAADRVIYIPLISFYAISEHEEALENQARMRAGLPPLPSKPKEARPPQSAKPLEWTTGTTAPATQHDHHDHEGHDHHYALNPDGTINLELPKDRWVVSAILVKARGAFQASSLLYKYKLIDPSASAVNPAEIMRQFFDTFLKNSTLILLLVSLLVVIVAAVGILVAIYNSVSARMREIAILRALGATRRRIVTLICLEAGLIGFAGAIVGILIGHAVAGVGAAYLHRILGQTIQWLRFDTHELWTLLGVVAIAVLAGLVPALKAYRTPVATNLSAV